MMPSAKRLYALLAATILCTLLSVTGCGGYVSEGIDLDGDGFYVNKEPKDCNDQDSEINPDATEICDRVDNDCDGETDEGGVCHMETCTTDSDCENSQICVDQICRFICMYTSQCLPEQDCTVIGQGRPNACLPATCGCNGDEVCNAGECQEIEPCTSDSECPEGQCISGMCYRGCQATVDCNPGQECVAMDDPDAGTRVRACNNPMCGCPDPGSWCLDGPSGCYKGNDCTDCGPGSTGWQCDPVDDVEGVASEACHCPDPAQCQPECTEHSDCPQDLLCNQQGDCEMIPCWSDADCPDGTICGLGRDEQAVRICRLPGLNPTGSPCGDHPECQSGACVDHQCVDICGMTAECPAGQVCGTDELPSHIMEQGVTICWTSPGFMCTGDEIELLGTCTDLTECGETGFCPWPTSCRDLGGGHAWCVCDAPICYTTCTIPDDCGMAGLLCEDGLCRPPENCGSSDDCEPPQVCGFIDGQEEMGRVCVTPGSGQVGDPCENNSDCASAMCLNGFCVEGCDVTGDCPAMQECQAQVVGDTGPVVGVCGDVICGCGLSEVCNLQGICGPGPLCNSSGECDAQELCAFNHCRAACQQTQDCQAGEDCTVVADENLVCLPATCNCASDEVCLDGSCIQIIPCDTHFDCDGGVCIDHMCHQSCQATIECPSGMECVAVDTSGMGMMMRVCTLPQCNCLVEQDWCLWDSCWRGNDCTFCAANPLDYECQSVDQVSGVPGQACRCINPQVCGPSCVSDDDCPQDNICDQGSCTLLYCYDSNDCPDGYVCGASWEGRICRRPGPNADGTPCSWHDDCQSGSCVNGTCTSLCYQTGDCQAGEVCGQDGLGWEHLEQGILICYDPPGAFMCLSDEFEVFGYCSNGQWCDQGMECEWPYTCDHQTPGFGLCVCSDLICFSDCTVDDDCGHPLIACNEGLCRPIPGCSSNADCQPPKVCGLVDGLEHMGLRCVMPGPGADGDPCTLNSDCASAFCADGLCARRCDVTGDCGSGQECRAVAVIGATVGACGPPNCGCAADQVCNLQGVCGPGPLCNSDQECSDSMCYQNHCRKSCGLTSDCAASEDCTGVDAAMPYLCLPATCGCAGDEVCEGGTCYTSYPCDNDADCPGGRCMAGQCKQLCSATSECDPGLECVAVPRSPGDWYKVRICTTQTCQCPDPDGWCFPDRNGCYLGNSCVLCNTPIEPDYECEDFGNEIEGIWEACRCHNWAVCGPRCDSHDDCPNEMLCDQSGACVQLNCFEDSDCPPGTVCGLSDQGRICRVPGPNPDGAQCNWHDDCQSGACVDMDTGGSYCVSMCSWTADCGAGQVCGTDNLPHHIYYQGALVCWTPTNDFMCADDEFEWEGRCSNGEYCQGPGDCDWPFYCQGTMETNLCMCTDPVCNYSCTLDADCSHPALACTKGICRALPRCSSSADCVPPKVCGLLDGYEHLGLRCVIPGSGADGDPCSLNSDCASAFCAAGTCARRCDVTGDCNAGDECQAVPIGATGGVVGACFPASCGCAADQVCNQEGQCGPGPLCNQGEDCPDNQACVDNFCRVTCEQTDQCAAGEDCTGISIELPYVCLPATCSCSGDEVCVGGTCYTARPCTYDSDCSTPPGRCVQGQCMDLCTSTSMCGSGLECVAIRPNPSNWERVRLCTLPSCRCPNPNDWCLDDPRECWNGNNCINCNDGNPNYYCRGSSVQGINSACYCHNLYFCGPRCDSHSDCPDGHLCDQNDACAVFNCQEDADCPAGTICGLGDQGRACRIPGSLPEGSSCNWHDECQSGACINQTCMSLCDFTADCPAGEVCGTQGLDWQWIEAGARICWDPIDDFMCTGDEFEIEYYCTDGTECWDWQDCDWPTECQWLGDRQYCACNDPVCIITCTADADCAHPLLGCRDGLCRPALECSSNADCQSPKICGFIDDNEQMGLRCVDPGPTADGNACANHSDCASGFCAALVCAHRCDVTGDCNAGDECQAEEVGGLGIVAGACQTASCGCNSSQVCNLQGTCGPGPLCNQEDDCQSGQACASNHCRQTCQQTDQCNAGEDCTGISANMPHVCLPATCGCAGSQVCDGGFCFDARPCSGDLDCTDPPGRCLGGQCYDECDSTAMCQAGLECVAVRMNPPEMWSIRLCAVPTCDCLSADTWCYLDWQDGMYCYQGSDCSNCGPDPDYQCWWVDDVSGVGDTCRCVNLAVCGPSCSSDSDCQPGYLCSAGNACEIVTCLTDTDCPAGTVCGAHPIYGYQGRACWHPGPVPDGDFCNGSNHWECQSATCIWNTCVSMCSTTAECLASEVCSYDVPGYPWDMAVCYDQSFSDCSSGCGADEWCYDWQCRAGQACFFNQNICDSGLVCDGYSCQPACSSSQDCLLDQECILAEFWDWDVVNATKVCRDPECRCRNRDDICRSDAYQGGNQRYCLRPVSCSFVDPCPDASYSCEEQYNYSCLCIDEPACGPMCLLHEDCQYNWVCDPNDNKCKYMTCTRDSDCPAGSLCAFDGNERFCALTGAVADGGACDGWYNCQNGMCIQQVCADPCADRNECAAGECQAFPGAPWDQAYPFCFDWSPPCGCIDTQFCDIDSTCQDGPACTRDTDCPVGWWCDFWYNKACMP